MRRSHLRGARGAPHRLHAPRQHRAHARGSEPRARRLWLFGSSTRGSARMVTRRTRGRSSRGCSRACATASSIRARSSRRSLGVSRSAVWKAVGDAARARRGAACGAQPRLPARHGERAAGCGQDPRTAAARGARARDEARDRLVDRLHQQRAARARAIRRIGSSEVLLAEYQTAGRGRRGRAWLAPPGRRSVPVAELDFPRGTAGPGRARARHRRVRAAGAAGARGRGRLAQVAERSARRRRRSSAAS